MVDKQVAGSKHFRPRPIGTPGRQGMGPVKLKCLGTTQGPDQIWLQSQSRRTGTHQGQLQALPVQLLAQGCQLVLAQLAIKLSLGWSWLPCQP